MALLVCTWGGFAALQPCFWVGITAAPLVAFIVQPCFVPRDEVCFLGSCFLLCSTEFCWGHWSAASEGTKACAVWRQTDRQMCMLCTWSPAQGNMESRCWTGDLLDGPSLPPVPLWSGLDRAGVSNCRGSGEFSTALAGLAERRVCSLCTLCSGKTHLGVTLKGIEA